MSKDIIKDRCRGMTTIIDKLAQQKCVLEVSVYEDTYVRENEIYIYSPDVTCIVERLRYRNDGKNIEWYDRDYQWFKTACIKKKDGMWCIYTLDNDGDTNFYTGDTLVFRVYKHDDGSGDRFSTLISSEIH